jgi:hypothetical protein
MCFHDDWGDNDAPVPSKTNGISNTDYWLGEILACIHGDGGHYLATHGPEKSTLDAIEKICRLITELDNVTYQLKQFENYK